MSSYGKKNYAKLSVPNDSVEIQSQIILSSKVSRIYIFDTVISK